VRLRWGMVAGLAGALALAGPAAAHGGGDAAYDHVGTFEVPENLRSGEPLETITSAEIVASTPGGRTLVYTDSPAQRIGFVDVSRPAYPRPAGALDIGGEPTSVAIVGPWALVAVNTSESFVEPSGELAIVDWRRQRVVRRITLAGQPDSVAISPDHRYAATVIENERDEDFNDGLIPQPPAGTLQVLDLGSLALRTVLLTGLAEYAPADPEPEYVDINRRNQAVVSLQENNHLAIVDLARDAVIRHFPAGDVTLENVDATEEELGPQGQGLIELTDTIENRRREPDAVHWIDDDTFATANEGDYEDEEGEEGGSRGFTLFNANGDVEWESGASLEHEIVRAGHFPQARAENKGNEPEGLEVTKVGRRTLLFVGSERSNTVAVYDVSGRTPRFLQILATGLGPEGISAIPERGLIAVSAETDGQVDDLQIRSMVTLYALDRGHARYPYIESTGAPWVALSGLSGDPADRDTLWAVSDSYLAQAWLYRVDVGEKPALITERIPIGAADVNDQDVGEYDLEGVVARPEGGFWFASEGRVTAGESRPNLLVRTDAAGAVIESVRLPESLAAEATNSGFEGITVTGSSAGGDETVYAVLQREWDDPDGFVKIARYEVAAGRWTFALYPLDTVEDPAVIGLSEITLLPDGHTVAIVERDDRLAGQARVKRLYGVDLADPSVTWREHGETLDTVSKRLLRDVLGELDDASISVPDKLEGVGVTTDGRVYLATDNDGVDENFGETLFLGLGDWRHALAP
jgi:Esterase-like activity of phytase